MRQSIILIFTTTSLNSYLPSTLLFHGTHNEFTVRNLCFVRVVTDFFQSLVACTACTSRCTMYYYMYFYLIYKLYMTDKYVN